VTIAAMLQQQPDKMIEAEYLKFERASEYRHELVDGELIAMPPTNHIHSSINASLIFFLRMNLPTQWRSYAINMRVKAGGGTYLYPDHSVICNKGRFVADGKFDTLLNPVVIIEVLSPPTEAYDRGKKFQHYHKIPTLREYLLVSQNKPHIERYLRQDDGKWEFSDATGLDAIVELSSIDCTLPLSEVYEQVTFAEDDEG
jgi:Uma2 family endonuclease